MASESLDNHELKDPPGHFARASLPLLPRQNGIDNFRSGQETISETEPQFFVGETTFPPAG